MTTPLQPPVNSNWLTIAQENAAAGQVANPISPGPITGDHAGGAETVPGRAPVGGQNNPPDYGVPDYTAQVPGQFPEVPDTSHYGPIAPFDAQGKPFAGSGVIPDTHSYDTGQVERKQNVIQPTAKGWFRRVLSGMTMDKHSYSYTPEGFAILTPTGRSDLDQYQGQNADAYDPFRVPYAERPIYANFAAESVPQNTPVNAYVPSGNLPDFTATGGQGNELYTEPDDPSVNTSGTAAPATDFQGGWL